MVQVGTHVFMLELLDKFIVDKQKRDSKKTYKTHDVNKNRGERLGHQKHDTLMVEVGNRVFMRRFVENESCETS